MSKINIVRYETRPESADENQQLIEGVMAELAHDRPEGVRYAAFRLDDGVTFLHVVISEEGADPLGRSAAFKEFQREFGERQAPGTRARNAASLVGSYRFGFGTDGQDAAAGE